MLHPFESSVQRTASKALCWIHTVPSQTKGDSACCCLRGVSWGQGAFLYMPSNLGLPWWLRWWRICLHCRRPRFDPWVRKTPWRREWLTSPVFLPGESHGHRNLAGYSPWGRNKPRVSSHCVTEYFVKELNSKLKSRDSASKFRPPPWSSTFLRGGESFPLSLNVLLTHDRNSMPVLSWLRDKPLVSPVSQSLYIKSLVWPNNSTMIFGIRELKAALNVT